MYWSDVQRHTIFRAGLNGENVEQFLGHDHFLGVVDGRCTNKTVTVNVKGIVHNSYINTQYILLIFNNYKLMPKSVVFYNILKSIWSIQRIFFH